MKLECAIFSIASDYSCEEAIISPPQNACESGFRLYCKASGVLQPKPYNILSNIRSVSACMHQNIAIDYADNLWTWGAFDIAEDKNGRCSYDFPQNVDYIPKVKIGNIRSACAAALHTLCIANDGILWAWGNNDSGQLGCGDYFSRDTPVAVMDRVIRVFANESQSYAITEDHTLWAWGNNENGLFRIDTKNIPLPIKLMENVDRICSDGEIALAIKCDKTLWGWGKNISGICFTASQYKFSEPKKLLDNIKNVSIAIDGSRYCLAVSHTGELYSMGTSDLGSMVSCKIRKEYGLAPIKVMQGIKKAACGHHFSLILLQDGRLFSFGENGLGQCGIGKSTKQLKAPSFVMNNTTSMAAGHFHGLGLQKNGNLWIWGGDYGVSKA